MTAFNFQKSSHYMFRWFPLISEQQPKRILLFSALLLIALLMLSTCGVKVDLPTRVSNQQPVFGAGDTSYIRISPDWDTDHGYTFSKPGDIIIGADGYIFIADRGQSEIHVLNAAGDQVRIDGFGNNFTDLAPLNDPSGLAIYPMAIAQDRLLNLFIADSSNRLWVWNQYLNNMGVDSMATSVQLQSPDGDLLWVTDYDSIAALQADDWSIHEIEWSADNLDQWHRPRLFWDAGDSLEAIQVARYFINPDSVRVTGVSSYGDRCELADTYSNTIMGLSYVPVALLMTSQGDQVLVYSGTMTRRTVSSGTGNGTVNDPRGIAHDSRGVLYFSQWGENFGIHKVGDARDFEYGKDDIMDIGRYLRPSDIALDPLGNIYVADTGHDLIQQFSSKGNFSFKIGISRVFVDSTIIDSVLIDSSYQITERDTTLRIELADILKAPRSVAVDVVGIVYIADTGNNRVMRYRLSTEFDYDTGN